MIPKATIKMSGKAILKKIDAGLFNNEIKLAFVNALSALN
jgi:hypothetical protein